MAEPITEQPPKSELIVTENESGFQITLPGKMQEIAQGEPTLPVVIDVLLPKGFKEGVSERPVDEEPIDVVINLHGQGSRGMSNSDIFEALVAAGKIVVAPTTSRRSMEMAAGQSFEDWQAAVFEGKGFMDEVADFQAGIDAARAELTKRFGTQRRVDVTVLASSLGGTMAAHMAPTLNPDRMILVAPSLGALYKPDEPIIGTNVPAEADILANTHDVKDLTVIWGDADDVIPREDCVAFAGDHGKIVTIPEGSHTFGKYGMGADRRSELSQRVLEAFS